MKPIGSAEALPRPYLAWLSGVTIGRLGDAVLVFALGWAAAGHGGTTAALVLTLSGLPRLVLLVVGGAVADQFGARRILIAGESTLLALTAALAWALTRFGTPTWLLFTASLALGTVTAFCLPSSGSMPRRLVLDAQLTRALAMRQGSSQVVQMLAAPLGGALAAGVGLPAIAWGDVVSIGASLCVLVAVREMSGPVSGATSVSTERRRLDVADRLRVVVRTPGLRYALVLTGAGAALMLPVPSLLVPLLGRSAGWGPRATGMVAGAVGVGVIGAALLAARRRNSAPRAHAGPGLAGLATSASGACVLASCQVIGGDSAMTIVAVVGALVFGFGSGLFAARLAPFVLGRAPRTHLARVQALVGLVQLVPVLVTNTVFGALAERTSSGVALGTTAVGLAACAVGVSRRAATRLHSHPREHEVTAPTSPQSSTPGSA